MGDLLQFPVAGITLQDFPPLGVCIVCPRRRECRRPCDTAHVATVIRESAKSSGIVSLTASLAFEDLRDQVSGQGAKGRAILRDVSTRIVEAGRGPRPTKGA